MPRTHPSTPYVRVRLAVRPSVGHRHRNADLSSLVPKGLRPPARVIQIPPSAASYLGRRQQSTDRAGRATDGRGTSIRCRIIYLGDLQQQPALHAASTKHSRRRRPHIAPITKGDDSQIYYNLINVCMEWASVCRAGRR